MFNSFLSTLVIHFLGEKVSSVVGLILSYIIFMYADFSKFVPAKYSGYVATALATLTAIFGAYMITPGKAAKIYGPADPAPSSN